MKTANPFLVRISTLLDVPVTDPDDARRRKLLNIILIVIGGLALIMAIMTTIALPSGLYATPQDALFLYGSSGMTMVVSLLFFWINRSKRIPGWVASSLFIVFLASVIPLTDTPEQLIAGRSLIAWMVPIVLSAFLLRSGATFIALVLCLIEMFILGRISGVPVNSIAIVIYFLLTGISALFSRSEQRAMKEVRTTNANLDRLVAERTRALAEALSRERIEAGRSKAILDSIADGVIVFDLHNTSIIANPAAVSLLEIPHNEIVGLTIEELSRLRIMDARNRDILTGLLANPGKQLTNFRILWSQKTLSITSAQVLDTAETPIGTVAVFRDFTREAEVEKMKNAFLAIVSHELRTPLNAIIGYSEMIKEAIYGPVNERQAKGAERILTNTRRLLGLVNDLLNQAQIDAGKITIKKTPFDLSSLIENTHALMDKAAVDKGLKLTSEIDSELPKIIKGDQERLQQILLNLTNNAIKFTELGSVHIRLFRKGKRHWGIDVIDTGPGIPESAFKFIFDSFRQVDSSATRKYGGFGLGLSIVKQLVELMHGKVTVRSKMGEGSTFTAILSLSEVKRNISTTDRLALIIEDDQDAAEIFDQALRGAGTATEIIHDGLIAQKRLKEVIPHIVVLDIHLPSLPGQYLLSQIRADKRLEKTIVLVATADALMADALSETADFVFVKPISFKQLRDLVERLHDYYHGSTRVFPAGKVIINGYKTEIEHK